jgi:hypothetical protein
MSIRSELEKDWEEGNGKSPRWDAVVNLMDDSIRDLVAAELAPCSEQNFWARYDDLDGGMLGDVNQW